MLHKLKAVEDIEFDYDVAKIIAKRSFPTEAFLMTPDDPNDIDVSWLCRKAALANKDDTIRARFEAFDKLTDKKRAEIFYKEHVSKFENDHPNEDPDRELSPYGISSREIQSAVRTVFPGELVKHAVSEGTKAVTKFSSA